VGLIRTLFPNARIIHCRRDAVDNGLSCYTTLFDKGHEFSSLLSGLITDVFENTQYLQCFPAKIFGVDLKWRPQDSCRSSERLSGP
jgi:hypothetical protein